MICDSLTGTLVDIARGEAVDSAEADRAYRHLHACARCRGRMAAQRRLSAALRTVRDAARTAEPAAAIDGRLMEAFRARSAAVPISDRSSHRRRHGSGRWGSGMAAAAALAILVFSLLAWQRGELARQADAPPRTAYTDFVVWPGAESLPRLESGQIVRIDLPVSILPLFGITPAEQPPGGTVTADVLVAQDGLARAVRLASVGPLPERGPHGFR